MACESAGVDPINHFREVTKRLPYREDHILSRYACYLIVMNGDPRKAEIGKCGVYAIATLREAHLNAD